jgi:Uma2 family endonuclease
MNVVTELMTEKDLLKLPDDGFRYELIEGELRQMPPAGDEHGEITMELAGPLHAHVKHNRLGKVYAAETGFKIHVDPDTVRAPDIAFVRAERIRETGRTRGFRVGAPDLAVEVVSPFDTVAEVDDKVAEWLSVGVRMVWVVNPRIRTVTVYRSLTDVIVLTEDSILEGGDVVPGFQISVKDIFDVEI